ncbi:PilN domain-containing protein [Paractinoplanes durhamensis]
MRILPIRANLLPDEIMQGRNARRTRVLLVAAVVLVALVMGGWYWLADKERDLAASDLASVSDQTERVRAETKAKEYQKVTDAITGRDAIVADLKVALAKDLPWATLLDAVRGAGTKHGVEFTNVVSTLITDPSVAAKSDNVATMQISGTAKSKATIADFLDSVAKVDGVQDVYLTAATEVDSGSWTFTMTAAVGKDYLCGKYTTTCGSK